MNFREETELAYLTEEDKKHYIQFDEISERILKKISLFLYVLIV